MLLDGKMQEVLECGREVEAVIKATRVQRFSSKVHRFSSFTYLFELDVHLLQMLI
jgi:hypothetical protein